MKMITTTRRQNSLSLSGGHIVSDTLNIPSYSPNAVSTVAQPFPWDDAVDDINTPDIDPSFFDNGPLFKKYNSQTSLTDQMDVITADDNIFLFNNSDQTSFTTAEDTNQQSIQTSYEDNFDLSSLINQTTAESKDSQSMVAPNDVLETQYIPSTTAQLHYLEPRPVEPIASTVSSQLFGTILTDSALIDSLTSPSFSTQFSCPIPSYSPALPSISQSYASPSPSPALSYTSNTSQSTLVSAIDGITSDNTIDSLIETKPDPEFLRPTVINDHLYTLPSESSSKRKRKASEKSSPREKNNISSKKSRTTKKDKLKDMEEKERFYIEDNAKCKKMIEDMERQIEWCKNYLFKKVVGAAQAPTA